MSPERQSRIAHIVSDTSRRLRSFIRSRVRNEADAEDVLQDVWHQLAVTLNSGPIEQVGAWLYTVARNRIIDRYRRPPMASLDALAAEVGGELGDEFTAVLLRDDHTPRAEHLRRLFWQHLHAALAELPEAQRQVFVWHELEALSFQQIAALTGENVNTLLSRKRYAILHLRERLAVLRGEYFEPRS